MDKNRNAEKYKRNKDRNNETDNISRDSISGKDIDEKVFGVKILVNSPNFRRVKNRKNPYIFGEYFLKGKKYTVYIGKDGIKIHPYSEYVFRDIIYSLRTPERGKQVFVDGNTQGFCVLAVDNGRVVKVHIFKRKATSNSNELSAIFFANKEFPDFKIFSDSSYAISVARKKGIFAEKVRAHSGVLWNTICDLFLRNTLGGKNELTKKN